MLMISQLRLINFQIFVDRTFKFYPGTNIIIGENNGGKSSIIRAIYWILNNKPAGDWMRRFDLDKDEGERLTTTVILKTVCGHTIKRIKGEGINEYWLDNEKFTSVGRGGPPAPIAELLGVPVLPFGKDLIPFIGMQDELPFMVFESAPCKGSLLNYLTGVDVGDRMRKAITKEARQLTVEINRNVEAIQDEKEELKKYADLDEIAGRVSQAEELDKKWQAVTEKVDELRLNQIALQDTNAAIKRRREQVRQLKIAVDCEEELQQTQNVLEQLQALNRTGISPSRLKGCKAGLKACELLNSKLYNMGRTFRELQSLQVSWQEALVGIEVAEIIKKECLEELHKMKLCPKCKGVGVISQ